jgi:D-glycero-D-manno-heptose 1,7-bisphosphate phosphatase
MNRPAVFLDRDGTIIEDSGYLSEPEQVRLLPGAADAVKSFSKAGYRVVLVSNQSGVARGLFDERTLNAVHARLELLLKEQGAALDAAYYCPYLDGPEAVVDTYRRDSELRKPKPGMLLQAAKDLRIDLARSWMIGNSASDIEAGRRAGCRTVLLTGPAGNGATTGMDATVTVADLRGAVEILERRADKADRRTPNRLAEHEDGIVALLDKIHAQLERAHRTDRQHDFSVLRLLGALLQMFAIVSAIWGAAALLGDQTVNATPRLVLASFLQVASLTAFAIDRFR